MTPAMQDISKATVNANVALIKSIPQQYLRNVEGIVMRSVQTGRDLGALSKDLQKQFGVTKRRAALISRDQNNKATSAFQRARQQELGITRAVWMHSHAGKEPRPTHVAMNGKTYDINKGMWDADEKEWVFPGQLINCRCTSRSVVAGFS
jgi:SPP1 gp7 family putative phage head morphogenesis protein